MSAAHDATTKASTTELQHGMKRPVKKKKKKKAKPPGDRRPSGPRHAGPKKEASKRCTDRAVSRKKKKRRPDTAPGCKKSDKTYSLPKIDEVIKAYAEVSAIHEACNAVPTISEADFNRLCKSLVEHGFAGEGEEILVSPTGELLDGRNRLMACYVTGTTPRFGMTEEDPWMVAERNLARRHMTDGQRLQLGTRLAEEYQRKWDAEASGASDTEGASSRSASNRGLNSLPIGKESPAKKKRGRQGNATRARKEAAKTVKMSERSLARMQKVEREDPELADNVAAGFLSVSQAEKRLPAKKAIPAAAGSKSVPNGKVRCKYRSPVLCVFESGDRSIIAIAYQNDGWWYGLCGVSDEHEEASGQSDAERRAKKLLVKTINARAAALRSSE